MNNRSVRTNHMERKIQETAASSSTIFQYDHQRKPQREKLEKLLVPTYRMQPPVKENSTDPWLCSANNINCSSYNNQTSLQSRDMLFYRDEDDASVMSGWSHANLIRSKIKTFNTKKNNVKRNYGSNRWNGAVTALSKFTSKSQNESNDSKSILPNFIKQARQTRSRQQKTDAKLKPKRTRKTSQNHVHLLSPIDSQLSSPNFLQTSEPNEHKRVDSKLKWLQQPPMTTQKPKPKLLDNNHKNNHQTKQFTKKKNKKNETNKKNFKKPKKFTFSDPELSSPTSSSENYIAMNDFADFQQYEDPDVFAKKSLSTTDSKILSQYDDPPLWAEFDDNHSPNLSDAWGKEEKQFGSSLSRQEEEDFFPSDKFVMQQEYTTQYDQTAFHHQQNGIDEFDDDFVDDSGTHSTRPYDEKLHRSRIGTAREPIDSFQNQFMFNADDHNTLIYTVASIVIQTNVRRFLAFNEALDRRWAIVVIQRYLRKYQRGQKSNFIVNKAATKIQACYRSWVVRDFLFVDHFCAIQIQSYVRMFLVKLHLGKTLDEPSEYSRLPNVVTIQAHYRGYALRKKIIEHSSAIFIQTSWRCYITNFNFELKKIGAILIQAYTRRFLVRRQLSYINASAIKIQSMWRTHICVLNYMFDLADILILQSLVRRWLAKRKVSKYLKKRYYRKTTHRMRHKQPISSNQLVRTEHQMRDLTYGQSFAHTIANQKFRSEKGTRSRQMNDHFHRSKRPVSNELQHAKSEKTYYLQGVANDPYFIPD